MIIGIDAIHLSRSLKGIGRVERSIIQTLARESHSHHFVVFLDRDHKALDLPTYDAVTYVIGTAGSLFLWEQFRLPSLARRFKVDCLLSLSDRIPLALSSCVVLYLFESPHHRREMALSSNNVGAYQRVSDIITKILFPWSLRLVKQIAVASLSTECDLRHRHSIPDNKITVVPASADDCFRPQPDHSHQSMVRKRFGSEEGYVLHFSSGDIRDNTSLALLAFTSARISPAIKMIIAGGDPRDQEDVSRIVESLGLSERVLNVGYVPESDLVDLYQAADAYIDPSLYEGFGLQVLEAMACGVPVVCSNTTSLPEIVGDAAITCDPKDVASFSAGIEDVINNPKQSEGMRDAGLRQAARFSWQRTARELVRLCERDTS